MKRSRALIEGLLNLDLAGDQRRDALIIGLLEGRHHDEGR
jgi:hypothetical protein